MSFSSFASVLFPISAAFGIGIISGHCADFQGRQHIVLNDDWKFNLGDVTDAQKPSFDDKSWRSVTLPHDWSIEGTFDPKSPTGGAEGFLPQGIGWYRHSFHAPANWKGKVVSIEFDGVYMNSDVWINGHKLGNHPYGYTAFSYELTPYLKFDTENVIAVRVDSSAQKNSRWYSGCGIYRHVYLSVTDPVHIPQWGVFIQTPKADAADATVVVQTEVKNDSGAPVTVQTTLSGADGQPVDATSTESSAKAPVAFMENFDVKNPSLWSPEIPTLYRATTKLIRDGKVIDQMETSFGVRSLAWSAENGLQLNGKTIKLCAGCVHNDNGPLGSACFDRAEERRVELLKAAGFNAIRTSHNPPSPAFLNACDHLGMLVMDEAFDCWTQGKNAADYHLYFKDWWQRDIDSMVLRDRNHPSIIFWSVGNEIPGAYTQAGADAVKELAERVKSLDTSRPVTEAMNVRPKPPQMPFFNVHMTSLDIMGCNYILDWGIANHDQAPSRILVATESVPNDIFKYWSMVQDHPYVVGDFVWTALDYIGENGIGRCEIIPQSAPPPPKGHGLDQLFPWHGAYCGDIDTIGMRKPISHYRNILWGRGEKLFMTVEQPVPDAGEKMWVQRWGYTPSLPSWTWPGFEGKTIRVDIFSRCDSVELFQDGKRIDEKPTGRPEEYKASFDLTYTPGTLRVVGHQKSAPDIVQTLTTVGAPAGIRLTPDRTTIQGDSQDLSFVKVEVVDKDGKLQPNADQQISFSLTGPGVIAGLGSGNMQSLDPYQGTQCHVFHGEGLVVIRSVKQPGTIMLKAHADGLTDGSASVQAED